MMPLNLNLQAFTLTVSTLLRNPSHLLPNLTIPTFLDFPEDSDELGFRLLLSQHQRPANKTAIGEKSNNGDETSQRARIPKIRALILDKDNTLCPPHTTTLFVSTGTTKMQTKPTAYYNKLARLRTHPSSPFNMLTNPYGILIVSNAAGSQPVYEAEAQCLEEKLAPLRIPVFRSYRSPTSKIDNEERPAVKKPLGGPDILAWFRERGVVERADEIAVVGDRLATDVLMASHMGAWSVWCRDGVTTDFRRGRTGEPKPSAVGNEDRVDYRSFLAKMECALECYLRERKGLRPRVPEGWRVD
jgi:phosphatidylglycerophosphatase GEP4